MTVDFNDYFWGEKNNGFDVLYHNMKYGLVASKEMTDFFRERSNIEESNSKMMTKLANKAGSGCIHGTFAPVWAVLKGSAERLSSLHLQMVQKITELVKDITKYAEELHKKHKAVKEEEAGTLEAVQAMQASTHAVQKAKELYTSRMQEIEKLKKDNCSPKDLEKAETKLRKQHDDYRNLVEKHNPIKMEFERRMTSTCKRFQDIEEAHLKQMREFLTTYIELLQTNHDMVGQVHTEFKRQFVEMTVDKLLEQFVLNKYTGLEKPEPSCLAEIVELDLMNWPTSAANQSSSSTHNTPPTNTVNNTVTVAEVPPSGGAGTAVTATTGASGMGPTTPAPAPPKREINLRNWFTSSSSSSSAVAAAAASSSVSTASPSSASSGAAATTTAGGGGGGQNDQDGGSKEGGVQGGEAARGSPNASVVPSMRNTKSGRGKMIIGDSSLKAIGSRIRERAAQPVAEAQQAQEQQPQKTQQPKEKSSRRTTSLLNLFMSNSQVSGFLRSRREKAKTKKVKKKKDSAETNSNKDEKISDNDEKEETVKSENSAAAAQVSKSPSLIAPTATPEVDEDGYSVQPSEPKWETLTNSEKGGFYSSSDSDSDDNERDRKIHVEIKPLNNGTAPISASVDELRATVENLSLSPLGGALSGRKTFSTADNADVRMKRSKSLSQQFGGGGGVERRAYGGDLQGNTPSFQQHHPQSPAASNASTPTTTHPYAPLQSPTLSASNSSNNKYADLGDVFSEIEDITTSAPPSATLTKLGRQIPTPTSTSSIAIPRPPSRRSEAAGRGRVSPSAVSTISRADSVGSLEFRTAGVGIGSSRGPSPLTIGISDTIPLAVAFHEMIHAYFRGSDESRCQVKMSGDMMLSFPAGIVGVFANNPNPAKLGFRIKNIQNLDNVIPNKQLVTIDKLQSTSFSTTLEFNMPALTALLRRQSEQNPTASYFNVDILKYQMRPKTGASSCPFQLVCYWKCEPTHTDIKIDYKYNSHAMAAPTPLLNISITVPVDGGVRNVQSKPHSAWLGESNRLVWNFTDISQHSDNNGVGTLRARLEVANGPSTPAILQTQFNCEGTTLSGIEFELTGPGYRLSLVKRRFVSGKYICEGDGIRSGATPTSPLVSSPNPYSKTG
ncbi:F-BAR domain only protein 2 isoform X2 [Lutzomyia longipalpis]|uniref:F-BAR domain only protein 2 isoform X2 n=1 Tax=Lutzomyia longipalpis TaxID=7200 RepID=UPI0024838087|nr:F-BAR domain only protein 2 isoform X2 [Lutzomyia longipalpis]